MDIIYTLIPGMMFFGVVLVVVLVWAVKKGQYEDMEGSANSVLLDDDDDMLRDDKPKENASTDKK
jgi:cbb3-type cytochrome oxidase maturation protein